MPRLSQFVIRLIVTLCLINSALAQDNRTANDQKKALTVTAYASGERVRFTAPSSAMQIRLEVYNSAGRKLLDNDVRGGNVFDWHLLDGQAEHVPDDSYLCVITVKTLSGRITQKLGTVLVEKHAASVQPTDPTQMTVQQSEVIGPVEENAPLTILEEDQKQTTTVIAHNGEDGQITRGRGALSFRLGDFFRGKDSEQMRLTAEGDLGIGVANPQAKLDVAGAIHASQGIIFPDGSIQFSAARKTLGEASLRDGQSKNKHGEGQEIRPETAGTGTTGQIPKWQDGPNGVLGDSVITELNGSIGINGPPNPIFKLDVNGHNRFRGSNVSFFLTGLKPGGNEWLFQTVDADGRLRVFDNTTGGERFTISQSGNVGIGELAPGFRLHVVNPSNFGLRVQTNAVGGSVASFGGFGDFQIDAVNVPGGRLNVKENGKIGIGTATPQDKLDVRGNIKLGTTGQLFAPGGEENLRIIRGSVDLNGNILAGSGFHVSHTVTGIYDIVIDTPFTGTPTVTGTANSPGPAQHISVVTVTVQSDSFGLYTMKEGDLLHSFSFQFIAIGPR